MFNCQKCGKRAEIETNMPSGWKGAFGFAKGIIEYNGLELCFECRDEIHGFPHTKKQLK